MFTIKKLIVFCAVLTLVSPLAAEAKTDTQTTNKPNKPVKPGGYGISTTTGWRKIQGWESDITRRDPNLRHWDWSAMREMEKSYVRLRPGQRDNRRPSHYVRPVHETPVAHVARPKQYVSNAPVGGHYARPVSVPLPSRDAYARLNAPATKVTLAAPQTSIRFSVPSTNARLSAPATFARLKPAAAPRTNVQLASKDTSVNWSAPKKFAPPAGTAKDEMSDCGGYTPDGFETPEAESNPYGVARHQHRYGTRSEAVVRGKLAKKKSH